MDSANKVRRLKVYFPVKRPEFLSFRGFKPEFDLHNAMHVGSPLATPPEDLTRQQFLATECILFRGQRFKVRDVIDYTAHVDGGVHLGRAKSQSNHRLHELNSAVSTLGLMRVSTVMESISQVTLDGLRLLREGN